MVRVVARKELRPRALRIEQFEPRELLAAVAVSPLAAQTSENGGAAVISVYLKTPPTANVVINLQNDNPLLGVLSTNSLTFTPANYKHPQSFRVTGQADDQVHGTAYYHISESIQSTDPAYAALQLPTVTIKSTHPRGLSPGITVLPAKRSADHQKRRNHQLHDQAHRKTPVPG